MAPKRAFTKNDCVSIGGAVALLFCVFFCGACRKIPESELRNHNDKEVKVELQPLQESTVSTPETNTTEIDPMPVATIEVETGMGVTTEETEVTTEETGVTNGKKGYVKLKAFMFKLENGELKEVRMLRPGEPVKILGRTLIRGNRHENEALIIKDKNGQEGLIHEGFVSPTRIFIKPERWGVIKIYDSRRMEYRKVPQIKLSFFNLYEKPIGEFHVRAVFFYEGEKIGEDSALLVSRTIGIRSLAPGERSIVFLRPVFELKEEEELNKENFIEVKVRCSVGFEKYHECGTFNIDQMYY